MAETAPDKTVPMSCPLCGSGVVIVTDVGHDFRTVKVHCPLCRNESFLAIPAIRSPRGGLAIRLTLGRKDIRQ